MATRKKTTKPISYPHKYMVVRNYDMVVECNVSLDDAIETARHECICEMDDSSEYQIVRIDFTVVYDPTPDVAVTPFHLET